MWLPGEHLPFRLLVDLAEGQVTLTPEEQDHLAACERCAYDLAWLERLIALMHDAAYEEPPTSVIERVKSLFRERRPVPTTGARMIHALLRFDSAHRASAVGLRADATPARQILLSADGYDVDLRIAPADGLWAVAGQLLPTTDLTPTMPGSAELLGAQGRAEAELNELSEFFLPPVRAGRYTLTVGFGDLRIVFPDLNLGV
ncbi:MAG: hypothetical protein HGA45_26350 [Chloroflexales bacterium]|nr:hypothetical protein [Chloroflexales bacterium]